MKLIILIIAIILDALGVTCFFLSFIFGIGVPISFFLDIVGMLVIVPWVLYSTGELRLTKGAMRALARCGLATVVEYIPFLGDISPSWSILVLTS